MGTEMPTQTKLTGEALTTLKTPLLSLQSKIKDLAVLAGVLAVPPPLNPPCAWMDNKTVNLGQVLLNSNWSIAVEKITPLWDHTTIWLVTVVGSITLCTTSNKPDTLMVSITTHTSLDKPKKLETVSLIQLTLSEAFPTVVPPPKTLNPN